MNWLNGKMNNNRIGEYNALPTSEYFGREEGDHFAPYHAEDEVISDEEEIKGNHNQTQLIKKKVNI